MNKAYINSRLRNAGYGMKRIIERMNYEAREQLEKENPELQRLDAQIKDVQKTLLPLQVAREKLKKKIRKVLVSRVDRAQKQLEKSYNIATQKMNTAITEAELIDARDAALLFIKQWDTYEMLTLNALKGAPTGKVEVATDGGLLVPPSTARRVVKSAIRKAPRVRLHSS